MTTCNNLNPWDSEIVCRLPHGHPGLHRSNTQGWDDHCHWFGDDCPAGTHLPPPTGETP
jgi:hypothetical protein